MIFNNNNFMGQILNRIKDIVSAQYSSKKSSLNEINQLDELENIINDLNSSNNNFKNNHEGNPNQNPSPDIMTEARALEILELPIDARDDLIKNAYKQKMKEYHPDRVNNLGKDLQKLAELKTKEINLAYEFLKKSKNIE